MSEAKEAKFSIARGVSTKRVIFNVSGRSLSSSRLSILGVIKPKKFFFFAPKEEESFLPSWEVSGLVLIKKGLLISSEDKYSTRPSLALPFSSRGTESSKSIIKPSASDLSAFSIQSSLLAGTKRGQRGNGFKVIPSLILLKTFFLSLSRN